MTVTLVNIPDVPIVSTGTYQLASGETTFSAEDLADAVQAAQDPTVVCPRLKLGHNDARFDEAIASGELGGEPAFGTVQNLRLSDDGQTILGDYTDVPSWLADTISSSYPGRSIEGAFGFTAASGHTYRLVITACALLGVTWPGVTSLDDLREVLEQNGEAPEAIAASGGELQGGRAESFVVARVQRTATPESTPSESAGAGNGPADVLAGMDLGNVRMQFLGDLDDGEVPQVPDGQPQADDIGPQIWWWPRSVRIEDDGSLCIIIDDDEGHLIQLPFTVEQGDLIYGQPQLVIEQYVPVTSDPDESQSSGQPVTARGPRVLASWPVRAASRPSTRTEVTTMRLNGVEVEAAPLRERLGLADDAPESEIYEALGIPEETETPAPEAPAPEAETVPVAASTATVPEGMRLIDADTLATLQAGASTAQELAADRNRGERDRAVQAAIEQGRIPVAARQRYTERWDRDADGTRTLLTASAEEGGLAPGLVPVNRVEVGRGGDGDGDPAGADADHERFMAQHFPQNQRRLAARQGERSGVRVRTEV